MAAANGVNNGAHYLFDRYGPAALLEDLIARIDNVGVGVVFDLVDQTLLLLLDHARDVEVVDELVDHALHQCAALVVFDVPGPSVRAHRDLWRAHNPR